jgi:hypothetical protein
MAKPPFISAMAQFGILRVIRLRWHLFGQVTDEDRLLGGTSGEFVQVLLDASSRAAQAARPDRSLGSATVGPKSLNIFLNSGNKLRCT